MAGGGGAGGPVLGALVWAVVVPLVEWSVLWRALQQLAGGAVVRARGVVWGKSRR